MTSAATSRRHHRADRPQLAAEQQAWPTVGWLIGEIGPAQIFVAVLGASNYTYAEASFSQSLPDWIASHVRAFCYFGGSARQTVRR